MRVIPFLNNRQLGTKCRTATVKLNFDHILSRLVCHREDIYSVPGEESDVPPFSCKFRKDSRSDLLAVSNEEGDIILYDTSRIGATVIKSFSAHDNAIIDLCWLPDKCQLISGSGDHSAILWDMSQFKAIATYNKHTASVKSVDICAQNSAIFATGSRDGTINVWDTREKTSVISGKPAVKIHQAHCRKLPIVIGKRKALKDPISSVSAVAFQDSENLASAGVADGVVKIWDLRKTYVSNPKYTPLPKKQMNYAESQSTGHGYTSLAFDSSYKTLYACSTGSKIFKFDCHSYSKHVSVYEGFKCATYFVKLALSWDDQYLLCGSSDDKAYIWKTSKPGYPILQLHGHRAEVTSVSWSPYDITKLATCGDDNKIAIWKVTNTEAVNINAIHAIAEPYSKSPKIDSPPSQETIQNSTAVSTILSKKSPQVTQTPSKPVIRAITSFFSPIVPCLTTPQLSPKDIISVKDNVQDIDENFKNVLCKVQDKSPEASQVLTPYNHVNKMNIMSPSTSAMSETLSSPESKNVSTSFLNFSSNIKNKENANIDCSPEGLNRSNSFGQTKRKNESSPEGLNMTNRFGQTKRKFAPKHSTPSSKYSNLASAGKAKGPLKNGSKHMAATGKTIMNYFSVILSPDK